ncbi:hypothetical protein NQ317_018368 [Molorchus minor]|uniref:Uncharacterized protein n=1 Tax=Molorchus minor TaxID=1323400 RepID=A0ABQ9JHE4_9CUCU|nr:hypothetical protein NQ317_018368 [Molorchus minor]
MCLLPPSTLLVLAFGSPSRNRSHFRHVHTGNLLQDPRHCTTRKDEQYCTSKTKRKIKDKNKIEDKVPFFDFSTLKSKNRPILLRLWHQHSSFLFCPTRLKRRVWAIPRCSSKCTWDWPGPWDVVFSTLVLHNSTECRIARQYLCQTAVFMCGLSILAFTVVSGNYHAYVMFAWIYGLAHLATNAFCNVNCLSYVAFLNFLAVDTLATL